MRETHKSAHVLQSVRTVPLCATGSACPERFHTHGPNFCDAAGKLLQQNWLYFGVSCNSLEVQVTGIERCDWNGAGRRCSWSLCIQDEEKEVGI
eukprot:2376725-Rhodomonas_salina.1